MPKAIPAVVSLSTAFSPGAGMPGFKEARGAEATRALAVGEEESGVGT